MKSKTDCIFCQIAEGKAPAHKIWEDETHMAFLSIFPNTEGFTVVMPKDHHDSYAFSQSDEILKELILACKQVANILDNYFSDVGRTGLFFEGFGVDHLHAKLFPMHGTSNMNEWKPIESKEKNDYYQNYPGYLCSNDSHRADDTKLSELASKIRNSY